jgi:hypothetical protein
LSARHIRDETRILPDDEPIFLFDGSGIGFVGSGETCATTKIFGWGS